MTFLYEYGWYFCFYSFAGWCCEVIFAAASKGKFVNRGFLNGPVVPIYGLGMVAVLAALKPFRENALLLYLGSAVICTLIELILGIISEKVTHHRLWDYSNMKFNLGGHICLLFSLIWGVGGMVAVDIIHPPVEKLIALIPKPLGRGLLCIFAAIFLADLIVTLAYVAKLNHKLAHMEQTAAKLKDFSDHLGGGIAAGTLAVKAKNERIFAALSEKARKSNLVERRLFQAFPQMHSVKHDEMLELLKKYLKKK